MASSDLLISTPGETLRTALGEPPSGVELVRWDMTGPAPAVAGDVLMTIARACRRCERLTFGYRRAQDDAPAQRLVTAVNAVGRNLAVVVDQGVKENKFKA